MSSSCLRLSLLPIPGNLFPSAVLGNCKSQFYKTYFQPFFFFFLIFFSFLDPYNKNVCMSDVQTICTIYLFLKMSSSFFFFCCSDWVTSILFSSTFIHSSTSPPLLLTPSSVDFLLVIVFFSSDCLF